MVGLDVKYLGKGLVDRVGGKFLEHHIGGLHFCHIHILGGHGQDTVKDSYHLHTVAPLALIVLDDLLQHGGLE